MNGMVVSVDLRVTQTGSAAKCSMTSTVPDPSARSWIERTVTSGCGTGSLTTTSGCHHMTAPTRSPTPIWPATLNLPASPALFLRNTLM